MEIERKYLLDRLPALPDHAVTLQIEQGYFAADDDSGAVQGRLRRTVDLDGAVTLTHTIKSGHGLVRQERERGLTEAEFDGLWRRTAGRRLRKTRYRVSEGEFVWEIDTYADFELVLVEVELPTAETVASVPSWIRPHVVREVTGEPEYDNYEIALRRANQG